jgi:hypothetical protein
VSRGHWNRRKSLLEQSNGLAVIEEVADRC